MNILKTSKRKILAGIMSGILLMSAVPFTGLTANAAEIPQETMTVTTHQTQIYYDGGLVSGGNSFVMADGSIAICANHDIPAPATGSSCTISRTLGQSYIDGNLGETSTTWAFLCFYYSEKLAASGAIATNDNNRSYATSLAVRRFFQQHTAGTDDPYTALMLDYATQITNAAQADVDGIAAQLQWIDGTAIYDRHNGTAARLALYAPNGNVGQPLLVYNGNIPYITTGYATLVKTSANPTITDGNSCYSLAGAVYGIYTDWNCTNQVGTFTTDEWGNSNTIELNVGNYYVRELTAPMGFAMDYTTYEVVVTAGQTATVYVTDIPQSDPVIILLQKVDAETGLPVPQGDTSIANAEFTIKYFSGLYDTNPEEQGVSPTRQWILRTDSDGFTTLSNEYKVSGDEFYYSSMGDPTLPIGTVTLQETKAPEGYLLNNEIFVRQITGTGIVEDVNTYNAPIIPEQVMKGSVELYKTDVESGKVLANAVYGIYFHDGTEVGRLTTDGAGYAKSDLLPYGSYYLQELTAPNGYIVDNTQYPFTISTDGKVITISATDKIKKGQVELIKESDFPQEALEQGFVNHPLEGAVYGIYSIDGTEVGRLTTDIQGYAKSDLLPYGSYYLQELTAPFGYEINETEYHFTISADGEVITITALDKPKIGTITPEYTNNGGNLRAATTGENAMPLYITGSILLSSVGIMVFIFIFKQKGRNN